MKMEINQKKLKWKKQGLFLKARIQKLWNLTVKKYTVTLKIEIFWKTKYLSMLNVIESLLNIEMDVLKSRKYNDF